MLSISHRVTFFVVHFNNAIPLESVVQTSGPGAMCSQQCSHPENVSTAMGEFTKPFLVACYATLHPALSVGRSVCLSVTFYFFYFFYFFYEFYFRTSLLLPKWSGDLKYGPCPPERDLGSRVSGLVLLTFMTNFF